MRNIMGREKKQKGATVNEGIEKNHDDDEQRNTESVIARTKTQTR